MQVWLKAKVERKDGCTTWEDLEESDFWTKQN